MTGAAKALLCNGAKLSEPNGVSVAEGALLTIYGQAGIWLIEFKLDRPAEEALAQIDERNYADKYDFSGKTVKKIVFRPKARTARTESLDRFWDWPEIFLVQCFQGFREDSV